MYFGLSRKKNIWKIKQNDTDLNNLKPENLLSFQNENI